MRKIKRYILLLATVMVGVFLTACGSQEYTLNLKEDGKVEFKASVQRTEQLNHLLEEYGISETQFSSAVERELEYYEKNGFETSYESNTISIEKTYKNNAAFNKDNQKLVKDRKIGLDLRLTSNDTLDKLETVGYGRLSYYLPEKSQKQLKSLDKEQLREVRESIRKYKSETLSLSIVSPEGAELKFMDHATKSNTTISFHETSDILFVEKEEKNVGFQSIYDNPNFGTTLLIGGGVFVAVLALLVYLFKHKFKALFSKKVRRS